MLLFLRTFGQLFLNSILSFSLSNFEDVFGTLAFQNGMDALWGAFKVDVDAGVAVLLELAKASFLWFTSSLWKPVGWTTLPSLFHDVASLLHLDGLNVILRLLVAVAHYLIQMLNIFLQFVHFPSDFKNEFWDSCVQILQAVLHSLNSFLHSPDSVLHSLNSVFHTKFKKFYLKRSLSTHVCAFFFIKSTKAFGFGFPRSS